MSWHVMHQVKMDPYVHPPKIEFLIPYIDELACTCTYTPVCILGTIVHLSHVIESSFIVMLLQYELRLYTDHANAYMHR